MKAMLMPGELERMSEDGLARQEACRQYREEEQCRAEAGEPSIPVPTWSEIWAEGWMAVKNGFRVLLGR